MSKVIVSESGRKLVRISKNHGQYFAAYVQPDHENQRELLLQMKTFSTEKRAIKWANKILFNQNQ